MPDRFFYSGGFDTEVLTLEGVEAHHLIHVLRAAPGRAVELFNGAGISADCTVRDIARKSAMLEVTEVRRHPMPDGPVLWVAPPKGDRFRWLIEKATELGVSQVVPVLTERGSVSPRDAKIEKLQQTVIAACKQSGRYWLMELAAPVSWQNALASRSDSSPLLIADPGGTSSALRTPALDPSGPPPTFAVGPEGGWTPHELKLATDVGAEPVSLGPTILRIETAALALAGWWRLNYGASSSS